MMTGFAGKLGWALVAVGLTASASLGAADVGALQARAEDHASHAKARIEHDAHVLEVPMDETRAAEPYRAHFGRSALYIPTFFHAEDGKYDLIVHFHGLAAAQESNIERARVNAVVVSINVGVGSGPYESVFKQSWSFPSLLKVIDKQVAKSGRAKGAHLGRLALSAWSAGYGSVSAILRVPSNAKRVDAVLLADGLHADFADERRHIIDNAPLQKYARVAEAAIQGDKLFALTHSSITTNGYSNTTETIGELLKMVGVEKEATVADGPRGMTEVYESHRGDFHVKGFLGTTVKDHIDHIWGMSETMLPYLRERWSR
jgi:hypothetical protein